MAARPAALLVLLCACVTASHAVPVLPALRGEGELHVYAMPFAREADRLSFTLERVSLRRRDGTEVPLEVAQRDLAGADLRAQRLVAWGRVPPDEYAGITVVAASATLDRDGERSRLLVDPEPSRAELAFRIEAGRASVVWLSLDASRSVRADFGFAPVFSAVLPPQTPPQVAIYATNTAAASVTVADRRSSLAAGVVAVGEEPRGIALDPVAVRGYVALTREDQVDVLDLAASASVARIRLLPGDGPTEVAFGAARTLLVVNERSRTLSFVDPVAQAEQRRVVIGEGASALLVDRARARAYVANRVSGNVTVIDLANRVVSTTIATDAEPFQMALSRDGSTLYVVHRGSAYLTVVALPSLALQPPAYVGLGVTAIAVDSRSDLIYLSRGEERLVSVYDPLALQKLDQFEVPGAVSRMAIEDAEDALLVVMPGRRAIGVVDLTSRKLRGEIPVGAEPYAVALEGERP